MSQQERRQDGRCSRHSYSFAEYETSCPYCVAEAAAPEAERPRTPPEDVEDPDDPLRHVFQPTEEDAAECIVCMKAPIDHAAAPASVGGLVELLQRILDRDESYQESHLYKGERQAIADAIAALTPPPPSAEPPRWTRADKTLAEMVALGPRAYDEIQENTGPLTRLILATLKSLAADE